MSRRASLREAREATGLSREHVVRLLEPPISAKTLERWEAGEGKRPVKPWFLNQLAEIYGVDVSELNGRVAA